MYFLGVDIGGTKLAVGVVDAQGNTVHWDRTPTQAAAGPEAVVNRLVDLCNCVIQDAKVERSQITAAGIGCGGPLDPDKGVVLGPPNLPGWDHVPLVDMLGQALGLPAFLDNDANAAAMGEHRFGAGRGVANMLYYTISTGIGGGVIIHNRIYRGENGNAAELGHMSVAYNGRPCHCGSRGCLETYASGTSIATRAKEAVSGGAVSIMLQLAGSVGKIRAETVVEAVRRGDDLAQAIWDETVEILSAGVANGISCFNPQRVVLGGGLTNVGDMLFVPLRRMALARVMPPLAQVVDIVPAALGNTVGVLGAAAVALEQLEA